MQDASGESTLEAKNVVEQDCVTRGVVPERYHADNGRYAENMFKEDATISSRVLQSVESELINRME